VVARAEAEAENTKVIMVAYEYTYQDHEYLIRTMNTKHEQCGMAFLLQAAHKIAVSCPMTFIIESVDSICRDSADTQYMLIQTNSLKSPKQLTYKPL